MHRTTVARVASYLLSLLFLAAFSAGLSHAQGGPFAYVTNESDGTVTVIDTSNNTVVTTISLCTNCAPAPRGLAVTPNGQFVYVGNFGMGTVSVISTASNSVIATIDLLANSGCSDCGSHPGGVAITPDGTRAYVTDGGENAIDVIDTNPSDGALYNTVLTLITADVGDPQGPIAMSPDGSAAYYTFGTTSLGRIDTNPSSASYNTHTTTLGTESIPIGVAVDSAFIYVANNDDNDVTVYTNNYPTFTLNHDISVGNGPTYLAITPDGASVYVVNQASDSVSVIDTATQSVTTTITGFCGIAEQIAITADGTGAYAADPECGTADVISTASNTETAHVSVGHGPYGVAISLALGPTQTVPLLPTGGTYDVGIPLGCTPTLVPGPANTCTATIGGVYPAGIYSIGDTLNITFNDVSQQRYAASIAAFPSYDMTTIAPVLPNGDGVVPSLVCLNSMNMPCDDAVTPGTSYEIFTTWQSTLASYCTLIPHLLRLDPVGGPYTSLMDTITGCIDGAAGTKGQSSCTTTKSSSCLSDWLNASGSVAGSTETTTISSPAPGAGYALNQAVTASFTCGPSSIVVPGSCTGTVTNPADPGVVLSVANGGPLPTSLLGTNTLSVTPNLDGGSAGLVCTTTSSGTSCVLPSTASVTYTVSNTFTFIGFAAPISNSPTLNVAKAGQAVPVAFQVLDASGNPVTNLAMPPVTIVFDPAPCADLDDTSNTTIPVTAAGNSGFQNLGGGNYQFIWKTAKSLAGTCGELQVNLGDGVLHTAEFKFK